jgi:hypothetical protein
VSFLQPTRSWSPQLHSWRRRSSPPTRAPAVLLAEERDAGRLRIAPARSGPGGENAVAAMRRAIGGAFGCPVRRQLRRLRVPVDRVGVRARADCT